MKFIVAGLLAAVTCAGALCYCLFGRETGGKTEASKAAVADGASKGRDAKARAKARKARGKAAKASERAAAVAVSEKGKAKPSFALDDDDEAALNAEQRALIQEIRKALDEDNGKKVLALVRKIQSSDEWPDGIPIAIRRAALEAAAWFGIGALPEIAGFLADGDQEILSDAVDAYESAMIEANGDKELATIVQAAASVINDAEALDSIFMGLNDMRPSVAVETIKQIWASGTEAAKSALAEAVEFLTGEEGITTPEQLDAWYNDPSGDNCDDEDAEEFYGPSKD